MPRHVTLFTGQWADLTFDDICRKAKSFGAFTSGQALLYSKDGHLLFTGGITESRGHEGSNEGADAIETFVNHGRLPTSETPVFGCALGVN